MTLTATEVFVQAMDAEFNDGNLSEAITLYEAAAQLYIEQGLPAEAEVCQLMAEIVNEKTQ